MAKLTVAEGLYVKKVLVRHLPTTLCMGKGMAQTDHAGTQMVFKYFDRPEVQAYCRTPGVDGFGTTITLMAANPRNDQDRIKDIVEMAQALGYVADTIIDPTYPVGDGLTVQALTCGYVLHRMDDIAIRNLISEGDWVLFKRD